MEVVKRTDGREAVGSLRLLEDMIPRISYGAMCIEPLWGLGVLN